MQEVNGKILVHGDHSAKGIDELLEKYQKGSLTFEEKIKLFDGVYYINDGLKIINSCPMHFIKQLNNGLNLKNLKINGKTIDEIEKLKPEEQLPYLGALIKYIKKSGRKIQFVIPERDQFNTIYHEFGHLQDMQLRPPAKQKFKDESLYPKELKQWFADEKNIELANRVSTYAISGPGEFIAETYARALQGAKIADEVAELYKKLKGPSIPGVL